MFLVMLNLFLIVVGMMMDIFSAIIVVVPLIIPIAAAYGVDPVHLGIIFLTNLEIGYLTPPVGLNLFISSLRFDKPVFTVVRSDPSLHGRAGRRPADHHLRAGAEPRGWFGCMGVE